MGSIIKTVSIPDRWKEKLNELENSLERKNRTFSSFVVDKIIEVSDIKISNQITLETNFDDLQILSQKMDIESLKQISNKANIIMITLEAFIKYEVYEGNRKHKFQNARDADHYLKN